VTARYVIRITPADVGARVSVRSRLPEPEAGATLTDTVGLLRGWSDGLLEIERRDGSRVRLPETALVAARRLPAVSRARPVWVEGRPAAAARTAADRNWRVAVAAVTATLGEARAVRLDFVVSPGRWVDLDSMVEVAVAGLRDGGITALDALVATKREGPVSGLTLARADPARIEAPPGPPAVTVEAPVLPLPGRREAKHALRDHLAAAWGNQPLLEGEVWVDLGLATTGALLPAMEPALDTLEPILGRDPRGQPRQHFFPNDHLVVWLRVRRSRGPAAVTLSLGFIHEGYS
jgi:hypothetical protein